MTRENDVFVRLRERIAIAQQAGAALFISLHADSIANRRVRGGAVYTLSEKASDKEKKDSYENVDHVLGPVEITFLEFKCVTEE